MAKLRVLQVFADKVDAKTVYTPGQIIEIDDQDRVKDIVKRGLAEEVSSPLPETAEVQKSAGEAPEPEKPVKPKPKKEKAKS